MTPDFYSWAHDVVTGKYGIGDVLDFHLEMFESLSRRSGRTRRRINSLEPGDVFVTYTPDTARLALDMLWDMTHPNPSELKANGKGPASLSWEKMEFYFDADDKSQKPVRFISAKSIPELQNKLAVNPDFRRVVLDNHTEYMIYRDLLADTRNLIMKMRENS